MIKKRLITLVIWVYVLTMILPAQVTVTYAIQPQSTVVIKKQVEMAATTEGQLGIKPEDEQTTPAAIILLDKLIQHADWLVQEAPIGTTPGAYKIEDKEKLNTVCREAKEARIHIQTEEAALEIVDVLHNAIVTFKSSRQTDIGQLALAAYYYGEQEGEEMWKQALWFDMNNDGKIDIVDLSCIIGLIYIE